MSKRKWFFSTGSSLLLALVLIMGFFAVNRGGTAHAAGGGASYGSVQIVGDTTIQSGTSAASQGAQLRNDDLADDPKHATQSGSSDGLPPPPNQSDFPNPAGQHVTSKNPGASGFNGISQYDQHAAGTGNYAGTQFSLEPPDQGLCANGTYVVESVNNAIAVYNTKGHLVAGVEPNSQFLGLAPEVIPPSGPYGPFISDPKCFYDWQSHAMRNEVVEVLPAK